MARKRVGDDETPTATTSLSGKLHVLNISLVDRPLVFMQIYPRFMNGLRQCVIRIELPYDAAPISRNRYQL